MSAFYHFLSFTASFYSLSPFDLFLTARRIPRIFLQKNHHYCRKCSHEMRLNKQRTAPTCRQQTARTIFHSPHRRRGGGFDYPSQPPAAAPSPKAAAGEIAPMPLRNTPCMLYIRLNEDSDAHAGTSERIRTIFPLRRVLKLVNFPEILLIFDKN